MSGKRYIKYLPTIPIYPDNEKEILEVKTKIKTRTHNDVEFFKLTDRSVSYAFTKIVPISVKELDKLITQFDVYSIILFFKYTINRARPYQIDPNINFLLSNTDNTPAYPAGHALQAYYLANKLGKIFPEKQQELNDIAEKCDNVRVIGGIHYPSDGRFSKQLVDIFFLNDLR